MATFTDNFNRPDETPIGSPWATSLGGGLDIVNEQLKALTGPLAISVITGQSFNNDQSATIEVSALNNFDNFGLIVRGDTIGNGYLLQHDVAGDDLRVFSLVGGAETFIGGFSADIGLIVGDTLTLQVDGTTLTTYKNGVLISTFTDETYATGSPGIWYERGNGSVTALDNFVATGLIEQPTIENIDTDNTVTDGQQAVPMTVSGFGGDITSASLKVGTDTLALTGLTGTGTSYTFNMNDVTAYTVDTLGLPFSSTAYQNQIEVTDGTDTATIDITREPKAGWAIVETVSAVATEGSIFENRTGGAPFDGSQIYYPTASNTSISATGIITTDIETVNGLVWDVTSKTWEVWQFDAADDVSPVITLLGDASVTVTQGDTYTDAGATAFDAVDGDITANIVTVNPVNTAVVDNYTITYNVTDSAGNAAPQVTRSVTVQAAVIPAPTVSIEAISQLTEGDTGTATATTTNATGLAWSATGAVSINASTGAYTVNSAGAWSITATATGDGGTASDTQSGTAQAAVIVSTASFTVTGTPNGDYTVDFYNPTNGALIRRVADVTFTGGNASVVLNDVAVGTTYRAVVFTDTHLFGNVGVTI